MGGPPGMMGGPPMMSPPAFPPIPGQDGSFGAMPKGGAMGMAPAPKPWVPPGKGGCGGGLESQLNSLMGSFGKGAPESKAAALASASGKAASFGAPPPEPQEEKQPCVMFE